MPEENCQKVKLLKLMELLRQETDENHPITTSQIIRRLNEMGISCERRTVGKDMRTLQKQGFEIMSELRGHENSYWIADRSFELPEIKILMDAVQAALFIPEDKTEVLLEKLAALGGTHQAELLQGNLVRFNTRKHSNHSIFYSIEMIEEAIRTKRKLSFRYYDLNENLKKIYRMDGGRYLTEPVSLIYDDNNYYMIAYSRRYAHSVTYRVDRMDQVSVEDEPLSEEALTQGAEPSALVEQAFRMFGGEQRSVTLRFHDRLMGTMYDKCGEDLPVTRVDSHQCEATVSVQISPPFWSWLFMYSGELQLVEPEDLIGQYTTMLKEAYAKQIADGEKE